MHEFEETKTSYVAWENKGDPVSKILCEQFLMKNESKFCWLWMKYKCSSSFRFWYFRLTFLLFFHKKFQKKKKKIFTCELLVAAYFDLRSNKIPKKFDEKYFFLKNFAQKMRQKMDKKMSLLELEIFIILW